MRFMKILYYDWNSNSNADICQAFSELGFYYEIWKHPIKNYENDEIFSNNLYNELDNGSYDCIFSFDYIPLLSYAAQKYGILYCSWIYDCPQLTLFSDSVYNECNRIFFFDREQCNYFIRKGVKNAFHLPLAVNVNKLNNMLGTDLQNISYMHDVSFIGSLYNENMYNQVNYLPPYLRGYLDGLINSQLNVYGYDLIAELLTEDIVGELDKYIRLDDSVDIKLPHEVVYENMLFEKLAEIERLNVLKCCSKYTDIALYTGSDTDNIRTYSADLNNKFNMINIMPPVDYNTQLPHIYRQSKINLNITCRSITSGMPLRVLDIMGSGGFLISNYQPELAEYFIPGEEVVLYDSMADLEDKVCYYLTHDDERIAIAQRGYEKVRQQFSYEKMLQVVIHKLH